MIKYKGKYVPGPFRIFHGHLSGKHNLTYAVLDSTGRAIAWTFSLWEAEILKDALNRKERSWSNWLFGKGFRP